VQCPLGGNLVSILVRMIFLVGSAIRTGEWRWSLGVVVRFRALSLRGLTGICGLMTDISLFKASTWSHNSATLDNPLKNESRLDVVDVNGMFQFASAPFVMVHLSFLSFGVSNASNTSNPQPFLLVVEAV
jgi:hypothetical protein